MGRVQTDTHLQWGCEERTQLRGHCLPEVVEEVEGSFVLLPSGALPPRKGRGDVIFANLNRRGKNNF